MTYVLSFVGIILAAMVCTLQEVNFFLGVAAYIIAAVCSCIGFAIHPDATWQYGLVAVGVFSMAGTGGYNKITGDFEFYHLGNYVFGVLLCVVGILLIS